MNPPCSLPDPAPSTKPAGPGVEAPSAPPVPTPLPPPAAPAQPRRTRSTSAPRAAWAGDTRAGLRIAARRLRQILQRLAEKEDPEADGSELTQVIQSLVRLKEAAIKEEQHRAEQAAEIEKWRQAHEQAAPGQGLTAEVLQQIERELNLF